MAFDFSKAYVIGENQRSMGFAPQGLHLDSLALLHGEVRPGTPVPYRQQLGSAVADLMLGGSPFLLIVSDLVVGALKAVGASGWTTYEVDCRTKRGDPIPNLKGLSVTGRSGPPLWRRSGRFQRRLVPGAPPAPYLRGLYIDEEGWDGSDVFSPSGTGFVVIGDSVYQALRAAKVRNFRFVRLTEFEMLDLERMAEEGNAPVWTN